MKLKAMLVCEDVRFEAAGTVTLVGVFNERLIAPPRDGPIQLARFAFLAVIGGLCGVEEIAFRIDRPRVPRHAGPARATEVQGEDSSLWVP